jgi:hypothetical protein
MFMPSTSDFIEAVPAAPKPRPTARPARGLLSGTLIETASGWRPVDALCAGDLVQTLDGGLRRVAGLRWRPVTPEGGLIIVPGGVLCNESDLELLPDQKVLIDGLALERMFGLPAAMVHARDLVGYFGVHRREMAGAVDACALRFNEEEVIWVNGGMCLHCGPERPGAGGFFETLSPAQARLFRLVNGGAAGTGAPLAA